MPMLRMPRGKSKTSLAYGFRIRCLLAVKLIVIVIKSKTCTLQTGFHPFEAWPVN